MKRKRKRNLYHLWFCFAMLLFLAVPFKVKAETATTPVSISVQYGQTEARTILNMINEMRTSSTDAWYWKQDDTTKTYCTNLQPLQYDYDHGRFDYKTEIVSVRQPVFDVCRSI